MVPSNTVILQNPKYAQNLGLVVRACACFGITELLWTGKRIDIQALDRTPRELRMKDYRTVNVVNVERPFDVLRDVTPVCVELLPNSESLVTFVHPDRAAYVFGPEDGDVSQTFRRLCHSFVYIPSKYCLNLAAAVNIVLYDRLTKTGVIR